MIAFYSRAIAGRPATSFLTRIQSSVQVSSPRTYSAVIHIDYEAPISQKLHQCHTTQQFVDFANQRGAQVVKCNKGTTKVSMESVTTIFWQIGPNGELTHQDRKAWVNAMKATGIAWD